MRKEQKQNELLFIEQLRIILDAEHQLVKALPKTAQSANSSKLAKAIQKHLQETERHVKRLEEAFHALRIPVKASKCSAMEALIHDVKETINEYTGTPFLDAAIIAGAQKIEHYEIATYGCICTWANTLGLDEIAELLGETLQEEKNTDEALTTIAEKESNTEAFSALV